MPSDVKRADRVAPRMRREISEMLANEINDPRVRGVVITRVEVSGDLQFARVFFRLMAGGEDVAKQQDAERGLTSCSGKVRKAVGQRMALQKAPELRFQYDDGQDARTRVEELLEEIRVDGPLKDEPPKA